MRYTVLTYIFNGYERVHEVKEKDLNADYVLVTDDPHLTSKTWKVIYDPMPRFSPFAKCYTVRFHPFNYADTPIIVRVDGSIGINKSLKPIVDEFERGKYDRCLMIHPHRNTLPSEYDVWVKTRGYPRSQADMCMVALKRMGYDLMHPLIAVEDVCQYRVPHSHKSLCSLSHACCACKSFFFHEPLP